MISCCDFMHNYVYCSIGDYIGVYNVDMPIINKYFAKQIARNNLHTNIVYLKPTTDVKISTFWEKRAGGIPGGTRI